MNIAEILAELEYRVEEGIIDLTKKEHLVKLTDILNEIKCPSSALIVEAANKHFAYIKEAAPKPKQNIDAILAKKFINPDTNRYMTVSSALGYDKSTRAYAIADKMFKSAGFSEKDIDMVDTTPDDEEMNANRRGGAKVKSKPTQSASDIEITSAEKKKTSATKPIPTETPKNDEDNAEGQYDPNNKLQKAVVDSKNSAELISALDELGKDEESKMLDKVIAGAGGPVASTGETMCVEAQTDMIQGRYIPKKVRNSKEYESELEKLKKVMSGSDKRAKTSLVKDLDKICDKMGFYKEDGSFDYTLAIGMRAEADLYIKQNIKEFSNTNVAKTKFKKEEDKISWMQSSFYSSYSLMNNGPDDWDRKTGNGRVMKANATTDGAVKQKLEDSWKNAKTPDEKKHYERQLEDWKEFKSYHDTYLVYTNNKGYLSAFHISNKKSDELNDPQNNTTPEKRIQNYSEAAKEANFKPEVAKAVGKAQDTAMKGSADNDNIAKSAYSEIKDINLITILSNRLPARSETDVKDEYYTDLKNDSIVKKWYKTKYGNNWQDIYKNSSPSEVIGVVMKIATDSNMDVSQLSGNFTKFILKHGQLAQSILSKAESGMSINDIVKKMGGKYSEKEIKSIINSPTMKILADRKAEHAAGLEGVHTGFTTEEAKIGPLERTQPTG